MQAHELKTEPRFYERVFAGHKKFELRFNDRGYRLGDLLILREHSIADGYTGRTLTTRIKYVTDYSKALKPGYLAMSISRPRGILYEAALEVAEQINQRQQNFWWCELGHAQQDCDCIPF